MTWLLTHPRAVIGVCALITAAGWLVRSLTRPDRWNPEEGPCLD